MARILLRMRTTGTTTDVEGRTKSERKGRDASRRCVHLFDDDVLRPLHVASRSFPSPWESRCSSLRRPRIYPPPEAGDANYSGSCEQFVEHRRAYVFNSHGALRAPRVFTSVANTAAVIRDVGNYPGITDPVLFACASRTISLTFASSHHVLVRIWRKSKIGFHSNSQLNPFVRVLEKYFIVCCGG